MTLLGVDHVGSRRRLDIYVAEHCTGCAEARRLAREAEQRFPHVAVRVVDLGHVNRDTFSPRAAAFTIPVDVVAVPTYVLDGRVISLGNPTPDRLFARLARDARDAGEAT